MEKPVQKEFIVQFVFRGQQIETRMKNTSVSPQEAIGLLEMAKAQLLDNLAKGRKQVFDMKKQ